MSPFTYSYIFLDCDEYLADQLFIKHNVPVKFGKEYCKNNSRYCVISCKIRKRYEEEFKKALAEMDNKIFNACSGVWYLSLLHVSFVSASEVLISFDNNFMCHPN